MLLFNSVPWVTASDIVRATVKNGLKGVIVCNTLAPVVTSQVNYLAGSARIDT